MTLGESMLGESMLQTRPYHREVTANGEADDTVVEAVIELDPLRDVAGEVHTSGLLPPPLPVDVGGGTGSPLSQRLAAAEEVSSPGPLFSDELLAELTRPPAPSLWRRLHLAAPSMWRRFHALDIASGVLVVFATTAMLLLIAC